MSLLLFTTIKIGTVVEVLWEDQKNYIATVLTVPQKIDGTYVVNFGDTDNKEKGTVKLAFHHSRNYGITKIVPIFALPSNSPRSDEIENQTSPSSDLVPLMSLVCSWFEIDYPPNFCSVLPTDACVQAAREAIVRAKQKNLARSQRERLQIVGLTTCIHRCFTSTAEILSNMEAILIALAATFTATCKNHSGIDIIPRLNTIDTSQQFLQHFSTFLSADTLLESLPTGGLVDVFGEFTWSKFKRNNFKTCAIRIRATVENLQRIEVYPTSINNILSVLKQTSPPIAGGKLMKFLTISTFTLLGLIMRDDDWRKYAPSSYTSSSGCVNFLKDATSTFTLKADEVNSLVSSMLPFLPATISFLDVENVACKAYVLKFNGTQEGRAVDVKKSKKRKRK